MCAKVFDESKVENYPQQRHGGELVNLLLKGEELDEAKERAKHLPMIMVDLEEVITLEMIATCVLSPNKEIMYDKTYKSVLTEDRMITSIVNTFLLCETTIVRDDDALISHR